MKKKSNNDNIDEIYQNVEDVINRIRPYINRDGGEIELLRVEDGFVYIRLQGACIGCDLANYTVYEGLERMLLEQVPGIIGVILDNEEEVRG